MALVDKLMQTMGAMHGTAHDFGTGVPLYRAEIHMVQDIGTSPGITVTALAAQIGVTKGAVSQTVAKLVKKGLVLKATAEDNAKEKILLLTPLGRVAFENHEAFHKMMCEQVKAYYGAAFETKVETMTEVLKELLSVSSHLLERKGKE